QRGLDPFRMAARGLLVGIAAFCAVIFAGPTGSIPLFFAGGAMIGLGSGLFAVSTLTAAMALPAGRHGAGLALGAWGAAQATAAGLSIFLGGALRDGMAHLIERGALGTALSDPSVAYATVYHIEIALIFATLVVLGPLVRVIPLTTTKIPDDRHLGIVEFPT
ncbi:MAG: PucC family protein, partial [Paracoccaceae bacterium]